MTHRYGPPRRVSILIPELDALELIHKHAQNAVEFARMPQLDNDLDWSAVAYWEARAAVSIWNAYTAADDDDWRFK